MTEKIIKYVTKNQNRKNKLHKCMCEIRFWSGHMCVLSKQKENCPFPCYSKMKWSEQMDRLLHFCSTWMNRGRQGSTSNRKLPCRCRWREGKKKMTFMSKNGIMPEVVPLLGVHLHKNRAVVVHQKVKLSLIYEKSTSSAESNLE